MYAQVSNAVGGILKRYLNRNAAFVYNNQFLTVLGNLIKRGSVKV